MSFKELSLKRIYRSKSDDLDTDLFIPLLQRSISYDRGAGYFSLLSLASLAKGIIPFIHNGGNIRLVTSVDLSPEDRVAIAKGLEIQESTVIEKLNNDIMIALDREEHFLSLDLITNLIAAKRLEIKIAYMPAGGIYHEKIGLFRDKDNNKVFYAGSQNETYSGYHFNLESVIILTSWTGDSEAIRDQERYLDNLWNNRVQGLKVFTFPDALKENLFEAYKKSPDLETAMLVYEGKPSYTTISRNENKILHPFQEKAIQEFLANGNCHFFEMATGTGKTFTAVKAVEKLFIKTQALSVIVLVPQVDLQVQWEREFDEIGVKSFFLGGVSASETDRNLDSFIINSFTCGWPVVAISTYDTFFSKILAKVNNLPAERMIIVDEAHNLSSNQILNLPSQFPYRLGLSATPERYDQRETEQILDYFTRGNVQPYKYGIEEAIQNNFLSKYIYNPIFINLDEEDFDQYQSLTKRIVYLENEDPRDEKKITETRNQRSVIVKKANCKLRKLRELVCSNKYEFKNSVIYCGQGKDRVTEESIIDAVTKILVDGGGYKVSQFTSKTAYRTEVLTEFEAGYYDVLAAIKCFDEGVDVPKLDKIYIMASDSLSRQTIQRRGRVLRKCAETGKKLAYIFDFVVLPPKEIKYGVGVRSLVINELRRVCEYNSLALNRGDNSKSIESIKFDYGIEEDEIANEERFG